MNVNTTQHTCEVATVYVMWTGAGCWVKHCHRWVSWTRRGTKP